MRKLRSRSCLCLVALVPLLLETQRSQIELPEKLEKGLILDLVSNREKQKPARSRRRKLFYVQTAAAIERVIAAVVAMEKHLWLNLADIGKK